MTPEFIIPPALSADVPSVVAKAVAEAAMKSGVARNLKMNAAEVHDFTRKLNIDGLLPNVDWFKNKKRNKINIKINKCFNILITSYLSYKNI